MKNNEFFQSKKLSSLIESMGNRFLVPEDYPFIERTEDIDTTITKLKKDYNSNTDELAFSLNSKDLDNILLYLFKGGFEEADYFAIEIFGKRLNDRQIKILWQLYQCHYGDNNPNFVPLLERIEEYIDGKETIINESRLFKMIQSEKGYEEIINLMNNMDVPINSFIKTYRLNQKCPFAWIIIKKFFKPCEKERYQFNED